MSARDRIDDVLRAWPYDPSQLSVRVLTSRRREVIQMRVDLGILQMEVSGRPDGTRPESHDTYYDFLVSRLLHEGGGFRMTEEQCGEVDREYIQFYHRRICWLKLQRYAEAVADADHSLRLMDFCHDHSPDENWTLSHEQFRPFILFHRVQAATLLRLEEAGPSEAVQALDEGVSCIRRVFREREAEGSEEEAELLARLRELRHSLSDQYDTRERLEEQLEEAIAAERYEDAARIRDELGQLDA